MKSSPSKLKNFGNTEIFGPLSSRAVISPVRESLTVAACCAVVDCRVENVVVRFEMSMEFCANSWPCCDSIATIAGSRVEWGGGLYTGGMLTEEIEGAPDNLENGGGGGTPEGLVEEEKRSMDDSN